LAGEVGLPLYGLEFLRTGAAVLPPSLQRRFPALTAWHGVTALQDELRQLAGSTCAVQVASRSNVLMRRSIQQMFARSERVLTTDLDWPAYRTLLEAESRRTNRDLVIAHVRDALQQDGVDSGWLVDELATAFRRQQCDGLYLTAVSHDGVRLPVAQIVHQIKHCGVADMVVVDGAQDFCHTWTPADIAASDVYITGCHKWLRAYQPLGVAFVGGRNSGSQPFAQLGAKTELDDPLWRFTQQLEQNALDDHTETVNVLPLFSCAGAVGEAVAALPGRTAYDAAQQQNAENAIDVARRAGWTPLVPPAGCQSGIVLLEPGRSGTWTATSEQLRTYFHERGIALTTYENGRIRVSVPRTPLRHRDLRRLRRALLSAI